MFAAASGDVIELRKSAFLITRKHTLREVMAGKTIML
jgi:hypothetical protein